MGRTGWVISGAGHLLLLLFVLFGGLFARDRIPEVTVADVALISEAEYAALTPPAAAPTVTADAPDVSAPSPDDAAPTAPVQDSAPQVTAPSQVEAPTTPDAPVEDIPLPIPNAVVLDEAPVVSTPTDIDGSAPQPDAIAAPAPRVAPVPQVAPPPETETSPDSIDAAAPDPEAAPDEPEEETTPQAPEAASDRLVTEAEEVESYAPASTQRPRTRPVRQVAEEEEEPAETDPTAAAIAAAVAEANATPSDEPAPPSGPPLTGGERDAFRVAVSQCWNVGSLSTEALGTTVVVGVEVQRDGVPVTNSIRLISSSGGSDAAARQAFEAARRAIIRCGARGFPLPPEKYGQWRDIEMTFNPEGMQFR